MFKTRALWLLGFILLAGCKKNSPSRVDPSHAQRLQQSNDPATPNVPTDFGTVDLLKAETISKDDSAKATTHWFKKITTVASVIKQIDAPEGRYTSFFKGDVVFIDRKTGLQRIVYSPPTIFDWVVDMKTKDGYLYMKDGGGTANDWDVRYSPLSLAIDKGDYSDAFPHDLSAQDLQCGNCTIFEVATVKDVSLDTKDPNGYVIRSVPLQRATVFVGGHRKGDGLNIAGHIFEGNGATADILCLQNCQRLHKGDIYSMQIGAIKTHYRRCYAQYGDCWDYDNLPYLWSGPEARKSAWQVLELCSHLASNCLALSTVNSRE